MVARGGHRCGPPPLARDHRSRASVVGALNGPPPLARGPPTRISPRAKSRRTTPARAGTTPRGAGCRVRTSDHPRSRGDHINASTVSRTSFGPPPLARGPHEAWWRGGDRPRTTPARAGTTPRGAGCRVRTSDHPRSRGDHINASTVSRTSFGPPPLARGPHEAWWRGGDRPRTTPARAGTTPCPPRIPITSADHPRSRGDHRVAGLGHGQFSGPPPLARGPRDPRQRLVVHRRTTPARAGTTTARSDQCPRPADHPRSRGDHHAARFPLLICVGPPPLARGPLQLACGGSGVRRTTPARAGTTRERGARVQREADHPGLGRGRRAHDGPPPLARGPRTRNGAGSCMPWTTPARAGTTPRRRNTPGHEADHPRSRGDHDRVATAVGASAGPPPLARGPRRRLVHQPAPDRTTPARAGTTWPRHRCRGRCADHPRSRGDHILVPVPNQRPVGPPPLARGPPRRGHHDQARFRTTPARAGTTLFHLRERNGFAVSWCWLAACTTS